MYKAFIENMGDSKYYAVTRHSSFVLDTEGNGANPIDTLLASLCGCVGHYVRDYMVGRQIAHSGFSVNAEAETTSDNAGLGDIKVSIDLKELKFDERQVSELMSFVGNCKVHKILSINPGVSISLSGH
jgi:uncharacterized OsmC-like protein